MTQILSGNFSNGKMKNMKDSSRASIISVIRVLY